MNKKGLKWLGKTVIGAIIVVILGFCAWFIQNGITNRPQVGYMLENCPSEINIFSPNSELYTTLGVENSGNTDAELILHLFSENITILNKTQTPYTFVNGSSVDIYLTVSKGMTQYSYQEHIYYTINSTTKGFFYSYKVDKNPEKTLSGIINRYFGEIKSYYPSKCAYTKVSEYSFNLTK